MSGPGKGPLKPDTSSHLKISASHRSISQTILTVGNEGEGDEGKLASVGPWRKGAGARKSNPLAAFSSVCLWVVLSGCKASKDTSLLSRAPRRTRVNGDNRL